MSRNERTPRDRAFLAPEVIQTSMMDCGPAALKSVLEGFGVEVDYEALRERCQTDVDGTSLDHLAALARSYGLATDEMVVPLDSLLLAEADCLPAIGVVRAPNRAWHFVVVWRTSGPLVQLMDPSGGRRWMSKTAFLQGLPKFSTPITADRWRQWAATPDFIGPLVAKARRLGVRRTRAAALVAMAGEDSTWFSFAALDAAVRMATHLANGRAVKGGSEVTRLVERLFHAARANPDGARDILPPAFWWASRGATAGKLVVTGPLIVHFRRAAAIAGAPAPTSIATLEGKAHTPARALPDGLRQALEQPRISPLRLLLALARKDAPRALGAVSIALVVSCAVAAFEAFLLRSVFDAGQYLGLSTQRAAAAGVLALFALGGALLDVAVARALAGVGVAVEMRFRMAFMQKLPRLEDGYLRSRPTSDMTSRAHSMHLLRDAPFLGARFVRALVTFAFTIGVVAWLYPRGVALAAGAAATSLIVSYVLRSMLTESAARRRALGAGLEQFYLDALRGVVPIRAHGAERAVRREHEERLVSWAQAGRAMLAQVTLLQGSQLVLSTITIVALVAGYVMSGQGLAQLLVLVFFATRLPSSGQELASALTDWLTTRNVALRLFAPLSAKEAVVDAPGISVPRAQHGAHVRFANVSVCNGGHTILRDVSFDVAPGSLVAIVGSSGAGKSSLLGLLLGWLSPVAGAVHVDGRPLDGEEVARLRLQTAWVDPGVYLWNRTLLDNVAFGDPERALARIEKVTTASELVDVLRHLPEGLQTHVGGGGTRVSAGQGQRVRLARAMMREDARLVLLDEPFRGLDRERRRALLRRAREHWKDATILFVSHDVSDTMSCDRALVVEDGRIVEDGTPRTLITRSSSRYAALARADAELRRSVWSSLRWTRKRLDGRALSDEPAPPVARTA